MLKCENGSSVEPLEGFQVILLKSVYKLYELYSRIKVKLIRGIWKVLWSRGFPGIQLFSQSRKLKATAAKSVLDHVGPWWRNTQHCSASFVPNTDQHLTVMLINESEPSLHRKSILVFFTSVSPLSVILQCCFYSLKNSSFSNLFQAFLYVFNILRSIRKSPSCAPLCQSLIYKVPLRKQFIHKDRTNQMFLLFIALK